MRSVPSKFLFIYYSVLQQCQQKWSLSVSSRNKKFSSMCCHRWIKSLHKWMPGKDICCVVSIFDMNHMWQICDAMDGTGDEMKLLGFHLPMQLLCYGWAVLINAAQWYMAPHKWTSIFMKNEQAGSSPMATLSQLFSSVPWITAVTCRRFHRTAPHLRSISVFPSRSAGPAERGSR